MKSIDLEVIKKETVISRFPYKLVDPSSIRFKDKIGDEDDIHINVQGVDLLANADVIDSLEDEGDAAGGAYTYNLYYEANGKKTDLYKNDIVGGESSIVGLHQVQGNLEADEKTYFGIGTLANGSS